MVETKPQKQQDIVQDQEEGKTFQDLTAEQSQILGLSDLFDLDDDTSDFNFSADCSLINQILQKKEERQSQISPFLVKKSINWLITFCWTRDYNFQILWNSIGYFYAYINSKTFKKQHATFILLNCVNLSLKLLSPAKIMKTADLQHIMPSQFQKTLFIEIEQEILQFFGFSLFFKHNLGKILSAKAYQKKAQQILLICQIIFISHYQPAINSQYLGQILKLINDPKGENKIKDQLISLMKDQKYIKNTKLKYSSKIKIDKFFKEIID